MFQTRRARVGSARLPLYGTPTPNLTMHAARTRPASHGRPTRIENLRSRSSPGNRARDSFASLLAHAARAVSGRTTIPRAAKTKRNAAVHQIKHEPNGRPVTVWRERLAFQVRAIRRDRSIDQTHTHDEYRSLRSISHERRVECSIALLNFLQARVVCCSTLVALDHIV